MIEEKYMKRALVLAEKGIGSVSTNPMVGAVIVANDRVIGEGYHRRYGEPHAEVNAVRSVRDEDRELLTISTMYVTLEPCCHYGKTPPCTQLIMDTKIPRVVIAMRDPFSKVAGRGVEQLQRGGVEVVEGILEQEARYINRRFITYHTHKRPYIILKWAESADGYIDSDRGANEPAQWLTGYAAKVLVHRWRSEEDAIMVGANTVIRDNPSLTVREWFGKNPLRVTIDERNSLSKGANIFDDSADTICYNHSNLDDILTDLYNRGIQSLFVEGGAKLLQLFIDRMLYDEVRRFVTDEPMLMSGKGAGVKAPHLPDPLEGDSQNLKYSV